MRAAFPFLLVLVLAGCRTFGPAAAPANPPAPTPPSPAAGQPVMVTDGEPASAPAAGQARPPFPRRTASVAFDVQVGPPGSTDLNGFVYDRDGKAVQRACVELAAKGGPRPSPPTFTTPAGAFSFAAAPPGPLRVTITVESSERLPEQGRIPDYHYQDPKLTVLLRVLVMAPPGTHLAVDQVKRQGEMPAAPGQPPGTRWIEVAPLALALEGYSAACRQALAAPAGQRKPRGR